MTLLIALVGLLLLLAFIIIAFGREVIFAIFFDTKEKISDYYDISKPTLSKWILCFCPEINYEQWVKMKKVSPDKCLILFKKFGFKKAIPKTELLQMLSVSYPTLRADLKAASSKFGLTFEQVKAIRKFPANLANQFINHLTIN